MVIGLRLECLGRNRSGLIRNLDGFGQRNYALPNQLHERLVKRLHPIFPAGPKDGGQLESFPFPNQTANGLGRNQNLVDSHPPVPIRSL